VGQQRSAPMCSLSDVVLSLNVMPVVCVVGDLASKDCSVEVRVFFGQ